MRVRRLTDGAPRCPGAFFFVHTEWQVHQFLSSHVTEVGDGGVCPEARISSHTKHQDSAGFGPRPGVLEQPALLSLRSREREESTPASGGLVEANGDHPRKSQQSLQTLL